MFEIVFGAILLGIFLVFWFWQHSWMIRRKLTPEEIDRLVSAIEKQVPLPAQEQAQLLTRIRAWAEADDGKPVYMFSFMRFYRELRTFPGSVDFKGTPEEANEFYEKKVTPLLLKHRGYPVVGGTTQGKNLMEHEPELDDWSRALVMRYPSRRDFLSFMADPAYGPLEPYKTMALKVVLVPVSGNLSLPDLRLVVGAALLILFLIVGWMRAAGG
ncbi:MAG: hypothetical protein ACHBNF_13055 [Chromatiales bacterium]